MSGVEFSTLYTARALNSEQWDPVVVVPEEGDLSAQCIIAGVRYVVVPMPQMVSVGFRLWGRTLLNPFALVMNPLLVILGSLRIAGFLKAEGATIAVTKGMASHFVGGCASAIAGVPCVWHVQDRVSERLGKFYPLMLSLAGRLLAQHMIADADSIATQLALLVPRRKISVVWNGVDTRQFAPDVDGSGVRREWGISDGEVLIGVVARMAPWKAQHILLEACLDLFNMDPTARVVLVGTPMFYQDEYLHRLQEVARRNGLADRVIFAGFRWDLPQVLAALDVFVHTAVEKDSSPLAVVSAMSAGKAVICPNIPGVSELFRDGQDGLLYPPGDAGALARQLKRVIGDKTLAANLGAAAREKAIREFGLDQFARKCENVFSNVLA
jgi:glycosyltransferase involved in cell wall biosynthesis